MSQQNARAATPAPKTADLLRVYDHLCTVASLSLALEMAIGRVNDDQQRAALEALAGQVVDLLESVKTEMERIRV